MSDDRSEHALPVQLVRIGWAYREPWWSPDHDWHLTRGKPSPRHGRDVRPVYLGPEDGPYIWPELADQPGRK